MIETERLIMRPFSEDDFEIIYRLYSDPEILRYTPFDTMDRETARKHLNKIIQGWKESPLKEREMAVIEKENRRPIGRCHISVDFDADTGMIGALLLKEDWSRGYAAEIAAALADYCFTELGLHRVNAICSPDNEASCRLLERCGMRKEAYYRQNRRYLRQGKTEWHDELEYAILVTEWKKQKKASPKP